MGATFGTADLGRQQQQRKKFQNKFDKKSLPVALDDDVVARGCSLLLTIPAQNKYNLIMKSNLKNEKMCIKKLKFAKKN